MKQRQPKFDVVLAEAVHEGLESICSSVSSVVLLYLKEKRSIRSDQYINDPQAFDEGLKKIFGFGAKVIEKKILEVLYIKIEVTRKIEDDFNFAEEVENAQKLLDSTDMVVVKTH